LTALSDTYNTLKDKPLSLLFSDKIQYYTSTGLFTKKRDPTPRTLTFVERKEVE